jgi:hypothetical protein
MRKTTGVLLLIFLFNCQEIAAREQPQVVTDSFYQVSAIPLFRNIDKDSDITLLSELHYVSVNFPVKTRMLQLLNRQGVTELLIESPLSFSIICNEYLRTGDSSLLEQISLSCEEKKFWEGLYTSNTTTEERKRISCWGIDFEIQGGNRRNYFLKASRILNDTYRFPSDIQHTIREGFDASDPDAALAYKNTLLAQTETRLATDTGIGIRLLYLLTSRNTVYRANRDKEMFTSFLQLDSFLSSGGRKPKYYGQFGMAHINLSNKNSLARLLIGYSNRSSVKKISVIGTSYINCIGNYRLQKKTLLKNEGLVSIDKMLLSRLQTDNREKILPINTAQGSERDYAGSIVFVNFQGETDKPNCRLP